ncbi:MAG TPA: hypothetical protein VK674_04705 [Candidatus Limnocylindria bacterium]|nr:hypothetical protein [Candidatus Limnocylindria bacterium]
MKRLTNLKFVVLFAVLAAVPFAAGVYSERAAAHEGDDHSGQVQAQTTAEPAQATTGTEEATYQYVAQAGDSYSLMARKAIQTFGLISKTKLSQAQIIFAETHITQEAKSPHLSVEQKVTVKESTVKSWVEKAAKLSAAQQKAWDTYAQYADFNTNQVGEAH